MKATSSFNRPRRAHIKLGRRGEHAAVKLLQAKGMELLARNWKSGSGELDAVMRDGDVLVFVEVKSRRAGTAAEPKSNLSTGQIRRIKRGAAKYMAKLDADSLPYRYDLVEVKLSPWRITFIRHHENCYRERKPR